MQQERAAVGTSATSPEPRAAGPTLETLAEVQCAECSRTYRRFRMGGGPPFPKACPVCHPLPAAPAAAPEGSAVLGTMPRTRSAFDVLQALADAGFNVRKYKAFRLADMDPGQDPHALAAARSYLALWRASMAEPYPARPWMYLFGAGSAIDGRRQVTIGKLGNGKTLTAWCIARALLEEGLLQPKRLGFVTVETLCLQAEATFRAGAEDSEMKLVRQLAGYDLLVIDELGVRAPSPHVVRLLDEVTKRREAHATIWTSNLSIPVVEGMAEGMTRITDRILGECGDGARFIVKYAGESYRLRRSQLRAVS